MADVLQKRYGNLMLQMKMTTNKNKVPLNGSTFHTN